ADAVLALAGHRVALVEEAGYTEALGQAGDQIGAALLTVARGRGQQRADGRGRAALGAQRVVVPGERGDVDVTGLPRREVLEVGVGRRYPAGARSDQPDAGRGPVDGGLVRLEVRPVL